MKDKAHKRQKFKKTTIILPYDLWESLRIESIKRNISMGELIAKKLKELEKFREKTTVVEVDKEEFLKPL